MKVGEDYLTPDGGTPGDVSKDRIDGVRGEVVCHALADEKRHGLSPISRRPHDRIERVRGEIGRNEADVRRERREPADDDSLLPRLGRGMVHFEDTGSLDARDPVRSPVEPRSENHDLIRSAPKRCTEDVVDVPGPDRNRPSGTRPVPVDDRPRQGGAECRKPEGAKRPPKAPSEKGRRQRIHEEASRCGARRLDRPVKGDELSGSADGAGHHVRFYSRGLCMEACLHPSAR